MFKKIREKINSLYMVKNYRKILPYVKPYWGRALLAVLITIPIGSMDAVIAWSLKPYMDVVMVEKNTASTAYIPILIIVFSCLQSLLNYTATYLNTWVGRKIANDVKIDLFDKLMAYDASFFDKSTSGDIQFRFNNDVDLGLQWLAFQFEVIYNPRLLFRFADWRFILQFLGTGVGCRRCAVWRALSADHRAPAD